MELDGSSSARKTKANPDEKATVSTSTKVKLVIGVVIVVATVGKSRLDIHPTNNPAKKSHDPTSSREIYDNVNTYIVFIVAYNNNM